MTVRDKKVKALIDAADQVQDGITAAGHTDAIIEMALIRELRKALNELKAETEMNEADKSILKFPVLWQGGGDAEGWIIERLDGTRYVRMTHRGVPYEAPLQSLIERMDEYGRVWAATFEAMTVLQGK